jgi:predicted membrane-bound spermidine synthase
VTAAVVWLVIWIILVPVSFWALYLASIGVGVLIEHHTNNMRWVSAGVVIGVVLGLVGGASAFVQVVLQIISVAQLASGG